MKINLREVTTPLTETAKPLSLSGRSWGYVFALLGMVLFSSKAIFVKLIYQARGGMAENQLDAITIMALRLGFSAPIYIAILVWILRRRKAAGQSLPQRCDYVFAMLTGMLGYYVCAWMDIEGIKYITAQLERLLLFTYPIFVFIFGALFFGKPLTKAAVVSIIVAYAGIGIIFAGGEIAVGLNVPLGTALVLSCAALFAFFQLFAKPLITRMGSVLFTCCGMLGAGLVTLVHFSLENIVIGDISQTLNFPLRIWILGIALAFFSTLLPSFLVNLALGRIGPQATAALGMIAPISTIALAIFVLGESFGWVDALGTAVTILGISLYTYWDRRAIIRPTNSVLAKDK